MTKKIIILLFIGVFLNSLVLGTETILKQKFQHLSLSERDLLHRARHLSDDQKHFTKSQSTPSDTIRLNVMAIRVEFQEDNQSTTTGNGKFDLTTSEEQKIDPPPHNRTYFESQLRALSNYYRKVSNGKLIIKGFDSTWGDIFPQESQRAYQLPHAMTYYGQDEDDEVIKDKRLCELFRDAFLAADSGDEIEFLKYDCFVIFHAGVGSDFVVEYDETPYDVSSAFLNLSDLREYLADGSPDYQGIPVSNGSFHIHEGIILPETQSQLGLEIGLLGTAAILFGSQIGLPNLFNTETGRAAIGKWGLMDQGSGNYQGLIPAQPCAWSKIFLGWEQSIVLSKTQSQASIAATLAKNPNEIYKIPINSNEYFLIENRQRYVLKSQEIAIGYDENGVRVELFADGTIDDDDPNKLFGVIVSIDEYDFGLPGSGILIWHIDEHTIRQKFADNNINDDPDHRGVALMEAHGAKDLGNEYGFLHPAGGSENGISENAFWKENESNKTVNQSDEVAFTPLTRPNSRANSGANSHIYITNFSDNAPVMTFDLRIDLNQTGFPRPISLQKNSTKNSLLWGDLEGDGSIELFAAAKNGQLFAWRSDGSALIENERLELVPTITGKIDTIHQAHFASVEDSILQPPALGDLDGDGDLEIGVVTKSGKIYAWHHTDHDNDRAGDPVLNFPFDFESEITAGPLILNRQIIFGTASGTIGHIENANIQWLLRLKSGSISGLAKYGGADSFIVTTISGVTALIRGNNISWTLNHPELGGALFPVVGDLNHDSVQDIFICFTTGQILAIDQLGNQLAGFNPIHINPNFTAPVLGDIDGDGFGEIVIISDDKIYAYHHNGRLVENFPVNLTWGSEPSGFHYGVPVLGDIDGDHDIEIIFGSLHSQVVAYHHTGELLEDFPLTTGGDVFSSVAILSLDTDNDLEIAAIAEDGYLYIWDFLAAYDSKYIPWAGYLHDTQHTAELSHLGPIQTLSGELMPESSVYNYPNPTEGNSTTIRYELNYSAKINIKIYDIAGELVDELEGPGDARVPNEITWQLENIQSGVYFARIEASGSGQNQVAIIKIAVVK